LDPSTAWSFGSHLTDLETLMWRLAECHPMFRSTLTVVAVLDRPADRARLENRVRLVTSSIRRLRDRVTPGALSCLPPRWEPDPFFELGYHLRWLPTAGCGTTDDLLDVVEALDVESFDRDRPPWQITIVDGLGGGRQGAVMRMHHAYTDGLGAVRLAGELFDTVGDAVGGSAGTGSAPPPGFAPGFLGRFRAAGDVGTELQRHARILTRAIPWAARSLRDALVNPPPRAGLAVGVLRSTLEQLGLSSMPSSPLLGGRSAGVRLAIIDLDLEAMRVAGRRAAAGGPPCTVNDVFLSGLLGGLGRYHAKHSSRHPGLRVGIPISTRSDKTGSEMRNQLELTIVNGPLRVDDPRERTRLIHELVGHARAQPLVDLFEDLSALGARLPLVVQALGRGSRGLDLVASNVPGPPLQLYLAGARVDRLIPFGPRGGSAINATLLSYNGRVQVGVNVDPVAVPDVSVLTDCLRSGFDELLG
jgi:WS/DGAT/MGAT family acyltransferase